MYVDQFKIFADLIMPNGILAYYDGDENVRKIGQSTRKDIKSIPYNIPEHNVVDGITTITHNGKEYPLLVFGNHNLQNIAGALAVCKELGLSDEEILTAITTFDGASKRLELVKKSASTIVYKDFAHSPSKVTATVAAVKEQFPDRKLVACLELHTFSSLTADFLAQYEGSFGNADISIVYFNPHTLAHKKLADISPEMVKAAFKNDNLMVFTDSNKMQSLLRSYDWKNSNLLLMSSGNFDGLDFSTIIEL
jgi:UDP-N-acetylmuramate: L-alanyl-gamma-D-glutamyl-meso-diaminopimelate ligase